MDGEMRMVRDIPLFTGLLVDAKVKLDETFTFALVDQMDHWLDQLSRTSRGQILSEEGRR